MIKMSSKYLGLSPKETIITAGKLFYKGCISFPKTESKNILHHLILKKIFKNYLMIMMLMNY